MLCFFFLMIRRPPRSTLDRSSAASDVYKRQMYDLPNKKDVDKCIITKDVVEKYAEPIFIKSDVKSA